MGFRRQLAGMTASQRYEALKQWVLPNPQPGRWHGDFRLTGFLMPTHPSPAQRDDPAFTNWHEGNAESEFFFAPARDLIQTAASIGKLAELKDLVQAFDAAEPANLQWSKTAMLGLIACQSQDEPAVDDAISALSKLNSPAMSTTDVPPISAEYLFASTVASTYPKSISVLDYVLAIVNQRVKRADTRSQLGFKTHFLSLSFDVSHEHPAESIHASESEEIPGGLIASFDSNAQTHGNGRAMARWSVNQDKRVQHVSGHDTDRIYFPSPLTGDYTIEADVAPWSSTGIVHLGQLVEPQTKAFGRAKFGSQLQTIELNPPLLQPKDWVRYRQEVSHSHSTIFLNGRMVDERLREPGDDPWMAFQGWWKGSTKFRDFSIDGSPIIPDEVELTTSTELIGWKPYFRESWNPALPNWYGETVEGSFAIASNRAGVVPGSALERLLQYHRPLFEDGHIEFDFLYRANQNQAGQTTAAPAIGRLALLLQPDGVSEHWVTDGRFDRTSTKPTARERVGAHQRHPGKLPLLENQWNRVRLSIIGTQLSLHLNKDLIYQRELPATVDRKFGVFYFADESRLRVRKVTMRGEWPKQLPASSALADSIVGELNSHRETLPAVFHQNFDDPIENQTHFQKLNNTERRQVHEHQRGRTVSVFSDGNWKQLNLLSSFAIEGDFDIEAGFTDFEISGEVENGGPRLVVQLNDAESHQLSVAIGDHIGDRGIIRGGISAKNPDGTSRYLNQRLIDESTSGRLRVVRRGDESYYLFAQGNSPIYRLLAQYKVPPDGVALNQLHLDLILQGKGQSTVTWTDLKIHATAISHSKGGNTKFKSIAVLDLLSGETRTLANGNERRSNVGSPKWSHDQTKLAFDRSASHTDTRLMVVDLNSGEETDIGYGYMPNFSPDDKQIAYSANGEGVGIANADGSGRRVLDPAGWGLQWSPQQNLLAYGKGGNLYLWDLNTNTSQPLLTGAAAQRYLYFNWNMGWSHDGRMIAVHARRRDGETDLAVVSLDNPSQFKLLASAKGMVINTSWSPDDRSVLVAHQASDGLQSPLSQFFLKEQTNVPLPLPDVGGKVKGGVWSPTGKQLALVLEREPQLVPWTSKPNER